MNYESSQNKHWKRPVSKFLKFSLLLFLQGKFRTGTFLISYFFANRYKSVHLPALSGLSNGVRLGLELLNSRSSDSWQQLQPISA